MEPILDVISTNRINLKPNSVIDMAISYGQCTREYLWSTALKIYLQNGGITDDLFEYIKIVSRDKYVVTPEVEKRLVTFKVRIRNIRSGTYCA